MAVPVRVGGVSRCDEKGGHVGSYGAISKGPKVLAGSLGQPFVLSKDNQMVPLGTGDQPSKTLALIIVATSRRSLFLFLLTTCMVSWIFPDTLVQTGLKGHQHDNYCTILGTEALSLKVMNYFAQGISG